MKNVQFTPANLTTKAFEVYSNCSFIFTEDENGYYIDGVFIGSLEDVNEYLEAVADC